MPQNMAGGMTRVISVRELDVLEGELEMRARFAAIPAKEIKAMFVAYREGHAGIAAAEAQIQADKDSAAADRQLAKNGIKADEKRGEEIILAANVTAKETRAQVGKSTKSIRDRAAGIMKEAETLLATATERELAANSMIVDAEEGQKNLEDAWAKFEKTQAKLMRAQADLRERVAGLDKAMTGLRK